MKKYIVFFQFINESDVWEQEVEAFSKEDAENRFYKLRPNLRPHTISKIVSVWMNPEDNITYLLQENSTAEVYYLNKEYNYPNITELTIPDKISLGDCEYVVTSIMSGAIRNFPNLKKIKFPQWLTSIGDYAFSNSGIEEIIIKSWLTHINKLAFSGCDRLKLLNIKTTLGLEELSKIKEFIRETTIVTSSHKGSQIFDINDWINLYDSVTPTIGSTPHITLYIEGSITLSNNNFTHCHHDINVEPKVSIVLNKNNCKINLDFHKNADIGSINKNTEDEIIAPVFFIEEDPADYSTHNALTITISSINEQPEGIDISGIDDLSEFDIE